MGRGHGQRQAVIEHMTQFTCRALPKLPLAYVQDAQAFRPLLREYVQWPLAVRYLVQMQFAGGLWLCRKNF